MITAIALSLITFSAAKALEIKEIQNTINEGDLQTYRDFSWQNQGTQTTTDTSGNGPTISGWANNNYATVTDDITLIKTDYKPATSEATVSSCPSGTTKSSDGCCCVNN